MKERTFARRVSRVVVDVSYDGLYYYYYHHHHYYRRAVHSSCTYIILLLLLQRRKVVKRAHMGDGQTVTAAV